MANLNSLEIFYVFNNNAYLRADRRAAGRIDRGGAMDTTR